MEEESWKIFKIYKIVKEEHQETIEKILPYENHLSALHDQIKNFLNFKVLSLYGKSKSIHQLLKSFTKDPHIKLPIKKQSGTLIAYQKGNFIIWVLVISDDFYEKKLEKDGAFVTLFRYFQDLSDKVFICVDKDLSEKFEYLYLKKNPFKSTGHIMRQFRISDNNIDDCKIIAMDFAVLKEKEENNYVSKLCFTHNHNSTMVHVRVQKLAPLNSQTLENLDLNFKKKLIKIFRELEKKDLKNWIVKNLLNLGFNETESESLNDKYKKFFMNFENSNNELQKSMCSEESYELLMHLCGFKSFFLSKKYYFIDKNFNELSKFMACKWLEKVRNYFAENYDLIDFKTINKKELETIEKDLFKISATLLIDIIKKKLKNIDLEELTSDICSFLSSTPFKDLLKIGLNFSDSVTTLRSHLKKNFEIINLRRENSQNLEFSFYSLTKMNDNEKLILQPNMNMKSLSLGFHDLKQKISIPPKIQTFEDLIDKIDIYILTNNKILLWIQTKISISDHYDKCILLLMSENELKIIRSCPNFSVFFTYFSLKERAFLYDDGLKLLHIFDITPYGKIQNITTKQFRLPEQNNSQSNKVMSISIDINDSFIIFLMQNGDLWKAKNEIEKNFLKAEKFELRQNFLDRGVKSFKIVSSENENFQEVFFLNSGRFFMLVASSTIEIFNTNLNRVKIIPTHKLIGVKTLFDNKNEYLIIFQENDNNLAYCFENVRTTTILNETKSYQNSTETIRGNPILDLNYISFLKYGNQSDFIGSQDNISHFLYSIDNSSTEELYDLKKKFLSYDSSLYENEKKNKHTISSKDIDIITNSDVSDFINKLQEIEFPNLPYIIFSRIAIHVCCVDNNNIIPLIKGLRNELSKFNVTPDLEIKSNILDYGVLESFLKNVKTENIKLIGIIGRQSSGKSYLLNKLFGTRFFISAKRCTDGIWISYVKIKDKHLIIFDCEGLFSVRRNENEEVKLITILTALCDFTILNQDLGFSRQINDLFILLNTIYDKVKGNNLFKGELLVCVRDVTSKDGEDAFEEFKSSFIEQIKNNSNAAFRKIFPIKNISFQPLNNFENVQFETEIDGFRENILNRPSSKRFNGFNVFFQTLKLLITQIFVDDTQLIDNLLKKGKIKAVKEEIWSLWRTFPEKEKYKSNIIIQQNEIQIAQYDISLEESNGESSNVLLKLKELYSKNFKLKEKNENFIEFYQNLDYFIDSFFRERIIFLNKEIAEKDLSLEEQKTMKQEYENELIPIVKKYKLCLEKCHKCSLKCILISSHCHQFTSEREIAMEQINKLLVEVPDLSNSKIELELQNLINIIQTLEHQLKEWKLEIEFLAQKKQILKEKEEIEYKIKKLEEKKNEVHLEIKTRFQDILIDPEILLNEIFKMIDFFKSFQDSKGLEKLNIPQCFLNDFEDFMLKVKNTKFVSTDIENNKKLDTLPEFLGFYSQISEIFGKDIEILKCLTTEKEKLNNNLNDLINIKLKENAELEEHLKKSKLKLENSQEKKENLTQEQETLALEEGKYYEELQKYRSKCFELEKEKAHLNDKISLLKENQTNLKELKQKQVDLKEKEEDLLLKCNSLNLRNIFDALTQNILTIQEEKINFKSKTDKIIENLNEINEKSTKIKEEIFQMFELLNIQTDSNKNEDIMQNLKKIRNLKEKKLDLFKQKNPNDPKIEEFERFIQNIDKLSCLLDKSKNYQQEYDKLKSDVDEINRNQKNLDKKYFSQTKEFEMIFPNINLELFEYLENFWRNKNEGELAENNEINCLEDLINKKNKEIEEMEKSLEEIEDENHFDSIQKQIQEEKEFLKKTISLCEEKKVKITTKILFKERKDLTIKIRESLNDEDKSNFEKKFEEINNKILKEQNEKILQFHDFAINPSSLKCLKLKNFLNHIKAFEFKTLRFFNTEMKELFEEVLLKELKERSIIYMEELTKNQDELSKIQGTIEENFRIQEEILKYEEFLKKNIIEMNNLIKPKETVNFLVVKDELIQKTKNLEKEIQEIFNKIKIVENSLEDITKIIKNYIKFQEFLVDLTFNEQLNSISTIIPRLTSEIDLKKFEIQALNYENEIESSCKELKRKIEADEAIILSTTLSFEEIELNMKQIEREIEMKKSLPSHHKKFVEINTKILELTVLISRSCTCETDHKCKQDCEACSNKSCRFEAGHALNHLCTLENHICKEKCQQFPDCPKKCRNQFNHDGPHDCKNDNNSHCCNFRCEFCTKQCIHDISPHSHHMCYLTDCPEKCLLCNNPCSSKEHDHNIKAPIDDFEGEKKRIHLCNNTHPCKNMCQSKGICQIKYIREIRTWHQSDGNFDYEYMRPDETRNKCNVNIPIGELKHIGECLCEKNVCLLEEDKNLENHSCSIKCAQCGSYCSQTYGHTGRHKTVHRNMENCIFLAMDQNLIIKIEEEGKQVKIFKPAQAAEAEYCHSHCNRLGRGHHHLIKCKGGNECGEHKFPGQCFHSAEQYYPNLDQKYDMMTCTLYWNELNFEPPLTNPAVIKEVDYCNFYCSRPHSKENLPENFILNENNKDSKKKNYLFCKDKIWHSRSERYEDHDFDCKHSGFDKIQICIMMDLTGSMDDYLIESKNTIKTFLNKTKTELEIKTEVFQIAFVGFKDHCRCGEIDHRKDDLIKAIDFTNETHILEFIEKLDVGGGGDWCEAVVDALDAMNNLSWDLSEHTLKFGFLVMDAPPHGKEFYDNNVDEEKVDDEISEKRKRKCSLLEHDEKEMKKEIDSEKNLEIKEKIVKKSITLEEEEKTPENKKDISISEVDEKLKEKALRKKSKKDSKRSSEFSKTSSNTSSDEEIKIDDELITKKKKIKIMKMEDSDKLFKLLILFLSSSSSGKDDFPGGCPCKKDYREIILQLKKKKIIFFLEKLTSHLEIMTSVFKNCGMNLFDAHVQSPKEMTELISNQLVTFLNNEQIVVFK